MKDSTKILVCQGRPEKVAGGVALPEGSREAFPKKSTYAIVSVYDRAPQWVGDRLADMKGGSRVAVWFVPKLNKWLAVDRRGHLVSRLMREELLCQGANEYAVLMETPRYRTLHWFRLEYVGGWWVSQHSCADVGADRVRLGDVWTQPVRPARAPAQARLAEEPRVPTRNAFAALEEGPRVPTRNAFAALAEETLAETAAEAPTHSAATEWKRRPAQKSAAQKSAPAGRADAVEAKKRNAQTEAEYAPPQRLTFSLEIRTPRVRQQSLRDPKGGRYSLIVAAADARRLETLFGAEVAAEIAEFIDC